MQRTGALAAAVLPLGGAEEPAVEVLLPELGEPHVPAVVLQGEPGEVLIEACGVGEGGGAQLSTH